MTDAYNNAPAAEPAEAETQRTGPPEGKYSLNEDAFANNETKTKKAYEEDIEAIYQSDEMDGAGTRIRIRDNTPQVILDSDKTARNIPMEINFESAYLATRDSGQQKGHYHGLGPEMMKELPAKLENPILMVKTKRRQNQQYH